MFTVGKINVLAARAIGVEVAAPEDAIRIHERQLREDLGRHAGLTGDAN